MGVGEGRVQRVRRRIGLLPYHGIYDAVAEALEGEAYAEDDVVRARHPQRVGSLKETLGNTELLELHSRSFPKLMSRS